MLIFFSVTTFVFGVIAIEVWNTQLPVWAFALALLICTPPRYFFVVLVFPEFHIYYVLAFVCTVPAGVIMATTNQEFGLNVITELTIGYVLPGRPIANMIFKTWGTVPVSQALLFTRDCKLGHYMKIPPRPMFFCQLVATIIAGTVELGVQAWMFSNIEDICSPHQKDGFICPMTTVFGTASVIVSLSFGTYFLVLLLNVCHITHIVVGCDRATASVLARTALLWPLVLLPYWHSCTIIPVDFAQEVQDRFSQVRQLPDHLRQRDLFASGYAP